MRTRIRDMMIDLLEEMAALPALPHQKNCFIPLESHMALAELRSLFVSIERRASTVEWTQDTLIQTLRNLFEPLVFFLRERWENIQKTDAISSHTPHSPINIMCMRIAEKLAAIYGVHPYYFLMPTLKTVLKPERVATILSLPLHRFVFSDQEEPFDVADCLRQAEEKKTSELCHPIEGTPLTPAEANRVMHHSRAAFNYYDAIQYAAHHRFDISQSWQKKEFIKTMLQSPYPVQATYGEAGKKRLAEYVMSKINHFSQLIDVMTRFVRKEDWKTFMDAISTDTLTYIVLEQDGLVNVLQNQNIYTGNADHDKAVLFCLSELYWRQRQTKEKEKLAMSKDEMTASWLCGSCQPSLGQGLAWFGTLGKTLTAVGKEWLGGYTLAEKELAVTVLQDFLMSDVALHDLDAYLKADAKRVLCRGALLQGELGMIANQCGVVSSEPMGHARPYECRNTARSGNR